MESFFRGIIRFRWLMIGLVLSCSGLAWVQLQNLRFESDADAMLPSSDPVIDYNDLVEDRFGIRDLIIIGVLNDNPAENGMFNPRTLGIVKEFSEQIARLPGIKSVSPAQSLHLWDSCGCFDGPQGLEEHDTLSCA